MERAWTGLKYGGGGILAATVVTVFFGALGVSEYYTPLHLLRQLLLWTVNAAEVGGRWLGVLLGALVVTFWPPLQQAVQLLSDLAILVFAIPLAFLLKLRDTLGEYQVLEVLLAHKPLLVISVLVALGFGFKASIGYFNRVVVQKLAESMDIPSPAGTSVKAARSHQRPKDD